VTLTTPLLGAVCYRHHISSA